MTAAHDTPESVAALTVTVIPYTDEDDRPDPAMDGLVMLAIGQLGGVPDHVLDRVPADAAQIIRQHSEAQAAEIERLAAKLDACILVKDRAFACATRAEAALADALAHIDNAWDAFGPTVCRDELTLAEQITCDKSDHAASEERERGTREVMTGAIASMKALADNNKDWPELHAAALEQISVAADAALRNTTEAVHA